MAYDTAELIKDITDLIREEEIEGRPALPIVCVIGNDEKELLTIDVVDGRMVLEVGLPE